VLGDSFNPPIIGSPGLPGIVGSLTNNVTGTTAAVQPVLATATDTGSAQGNEVAGTIAPVEAAAEPVLAPVTDTVGVLSNEVAGTIAPVEAAAEPVLATVTDTVGNPSNEAAGTTAPVEAAAEPVLATVTDTVGNPSNVAAGTTAPVEAAAEPVTATDSASTLDNDAAIVTTDAPNVDPAAIAGDVIALSDAPPPPENALFTGNQYTDYGVTLSSDIAVPPQDAASPADAASVHDTSVPVVADQKQAPPPPDILDTTQPIDHLGHAML
jgi:hypothetical protein